MMPGPRSADDYRQAAQQLLPPGRLFQIQPGSNLDKLLSFFAQEPARIDAAAFNLLNEAHPETTFDMLPEWNAETMLPDDCAPAVQTTQQQRDALIQKLTENDTVTLAFLQAVAAQIGFAVTPVKMHRRLFGNLYGGNVYGTPYGSEEWNYVIQINAGMTNVQFRFYGSAAYGEAYASWGNTLLECVLNKLIGVGRLQFIYS